MDTITSTVPLMRYSSYNFQNLLFDIIYSAHDISTDLMRYFHYTFVQPFLDVKMVTERVIEVVKNFDKVF